MDLQSHIVSIDDARRTSNGRRAASAAHAFTAHSHERLRSRMSGRVDHRDEPDRGTSRSSRSSHSSRSSRFRVYDDYAEPLAFGGGTARNAHSRHRETWETPQHTTRERGHQKRDARYQSFDRQASDRKSAASRARTKERAQRKFDRQYGAPQSDTQDAGPRAAVYKTSMGSSHRRASRMQNEDQRRTRPASSPSRKRTIPRGFQVVAVVVACVMLSCVVLYQPAQQYYQQIRERDRLEAEYTALVNRNDALQHEVDYLSTEAGVEDRARKELGWVKKGEQVASVAGIDIEDESTFMANITAGSIEPPDTWYSGALDPFFGVE